MLRQLLVSFFVAGGLLVAGVAAPQVSALDIPCTSSNAGQCNIVKSKTPLANQIWDIVGFALMILGGLAVIVIIIAGFFYVTSNGDSSKLAAAKNTILYAVIGLVVALLASAIISFVNNFVAKS